MGAGIAGRSVPAGTLIACTSGSTGTPKGALLRAAGVLSAIHASAQFITALTGTGPGPWLLALPPHHIAGTMVILRSLDAGEEPMVLSPGNEGFTPDSFIAATDRLVAQHPGKQLYTSLVPAQLHRLLDATSSLLNEQPVAVTALRRYAAILLGGGATPRSLLERCRELGITVILTYGSSETAGGVVYNGQPLPGFRIGIDHSSSATAGRIELSGPSVATGYRKTASLAPTATADAFPRLGVFRTSDLGEIRDDILTVRGRSDGAINSGGLKILPEEVERHLADAGFSVCAGVAHNEWGEAVAVLVEDADHPENTDVTASLRATLKARGIPAQLIPRHAFTTVRLPIIGPGKPDRRRIASTLSTLTSY